MPETEWNSTTAPEEGATVYVLAFTTVRLSEPGSLDNPWRAIR